MCDLALHTYLFVVKGTKIFLRHVKNFIPAAAVM